MQADHKPIMSKKRHESSKRSLKRMFRRIYMLILLDNKINFKESYLIFGRLYLKSSAYLGKIQ
jgi:hypothetical protein